MFFKLGLPDLELSENDCRMEYVSDNYPIGWALWYRDVKIARHAIIELGSDEHHIRIDLKDCYNGDPLKVQIDQIVIWDKGNQYNVPINLTDEGALSYLEELVGMVDLTVQALQNGDDEEGVKAFAQLKDLKRMLTPRPWSKSLEFSNLTP